ncbi:hypothetical protein ELQ32_19515, partial [Limnobaculum zhutongyuii]
MSKNISLLVSTGGASSQAISLDSNNPVRIKIQEGHQYILKNQDNNHSPQNVTLKRHGNDLYVILEGDTDPTIVIDNYYVSGNHQPLLGIAEDGQLYSYITSDALGEGYMLADEGVTSVALGGSSLGDSSYLFESVEYSDGLMASWPWFLGAAAIGGIGYAIYDNNKDDDSSSSSSSSSQPAVQAESQPISQSESQPESQSIAQSESEPVPLPTPDEAINVIDDITTPAQPVASSLVIDSQSGSVLSGTKLASTLPTFSGEGEPGSVITFMDDATVSKQIVMAKSGKHLLMADNATVMSDSSYVIGQVVVGADGKWSFTPDKPLSEGSHHITMIATDKLGNQSTVTELMAFEVDITAPETPVINTVLDSSGDLNHPILLDGITREAKPIITGQGEPKSAITITDHGEVIGHVIADEYGNWTFTSEVALSEGAHSICVAAADGAGNGSQISNAFVFNVDTLAPEQPVISNITDDKNPSFVGEGEPNSTVTIFDNGVLIGQASVSGEGQWVFTPKEPLSEGAHSITVCVTDSAGNVSDPSAAFEFISEAIDLPTELAVPTIESARDDVGLIQGTLHSGDFTDASTPTLSGKAEANSVVNVYGDSMLLGSVVADSNGQWSFTPASALSDGQYIFTATVTNSAGNVSTSSDIFVLTVDTIAPEAASILEIAQYLCGSAQLVMGTAEANSVVTVYDNGRVIGSTTVDSTGLWELRLDPVSEPGEHALTTVVTDRAGNISEASPEHHFYINVRSISITGLSDWSGDITGNIFPGSVTDELRPQITGLAEVGYVIKIYDGSTLLGSTTTLEDGKWSFTPTDDLAQGEHSITAVAIDANGIVGEPTSKITFTIDITPPDAPTIESVYADFRGELTSDVIINNTLPMLNGVAEHGSTVRIFDNGVLIAIVEADSTSGKWNFMPEKALLFGEHIFTAEASDVAGNSSSQSPEFVVIIDSELCIIPPVLEEPVEQTIPATIEKLIDDVGSIIGEIAPHGVTDDVRPEIVGRANAGNIVNVYGNDGLLGSALTDADGKWSLIPAMDLAEGTHRLSAIVMNPEGPVRDVASIFEFTVDTIAPEKPLLDFNIR